MFVVVCVIVVVLGVVGVALYYKKFGGKQKVPKNNFLFLISFFFLHSIKPKKNYFKLANLFANSQSVDLKSSVTLTKDDFLHDIEIKERLGGGNFGGNKLSCLTDLIALYSCYSNPLFFFRISEKTFTAGSGFKRMWL